jgi:Ca2+-binding RTX toxin-like protein
VDAVDENVGFAQVGKIQIAQVVDNTISIADVIDVHATGLALSEKDQALEGGWQKDVIAGNGGLDWIDGAYGDDILAAGSSAITGDSSDIATLNGSEGNDVLVAVNGVVNAIGGEGNNTFAFFETKENLHVELVSQDFKAGDKIDISQILSNPLDTELLTNLIENAVVHGNDRQIDLSTLTAPDNDQVLLTIIGGNNPQSMPQISDFVSSQTDSSEWVNQLDPLVYQNHG